MFSVPLAKNPARKGGAEARRGLVGAVLVVPSQLGESDKIFSGQMGELGDVWLQTFAAIKKPSRQQEAVSEGRFTALDGGYDGPRPHRADTYPHEASDDEDGGKGARRRAQAGQPSTLNYRPRAVLTVYENSDLR